MSLATCMESSGMDCVHYTALPIKESGKLDLTSHLQMEQSLTFHNYERFVVGPASG